MVRKPSKKELVKRMNKIIHELTGLEFEPAVTQELLDLVKLIMQTKYREIEDEKNNKIIQQAIVAALVNKIV